MLDGMTLNHPSRETPLDIRFGESPVPTGCSGCGRLDKYGLFVILGPKMTFICVRCSAAAVVKLQDLYPDAKLFDVEVNVESKEIRAAADAIRKVLPEISDSKAMEAAQAALYAI